LLRNRVYNDIIHMIEEADTTKGPKAVMIGVDTETSALPHNLLNDLVSTLIGAVNDYGVSDSGPGLKEKNRVLRSRGIEE
jgi:hypothetical protein